MCHLQKVDDTLNDGHGRIPILATKFNLKLTILTFWTKFAEKEHFWSIKKKVNTATELCIIELVKVSSFTLNRKYWQFRPNLPKKGVPTWKRKIRITLGIKFHLKLTILIFWTKLSQTGYFRPKTKKSEHPYWILHIGISLNIKFHLTDNFNFLDQICPKSVFPIKNRKKWTSPLNSVYSN